MKLEATFGHGLDSAGREAMVERMRATPHAFVAQEWVRLSQAPTWSSERERFEPRVVGLRLYAVATATGYDVMPGGLARVSPETGTEVISMQRGGSSKDIWVLDGAATVYESLLQPRLTAGDIVRAGFYSPSRAVENLFWMGRYAERVESVGRLLRATALRLVESEPVNLGGCRLFFAFFLVEDCSMAPARSPSLRVSHKAVSTSTPAKVDGSLSTNRRAVARSSRPTDSTRSA